MPRAVEPGSPRLHEPYMPNLTLPTTIRDNPRIHALLDGGSRMPVVLKFFSTCDACDTKD